MKVCLKKSGEFPKKEEVSVIKKFLQFLQSQVPLNKKIQITFTDVREVPMTTGVRMPGNEIFVLAKGRLLIDILRTVSHEWIHEFQSQKMGVKDNVKIQDIGGPEENMCNILSGVFIKKFEKKYPEFNKVTYGESVNEEILYEISPKSSGVGNFLDFMKNNPNYMIQVGFKDYQWLEDYIESASYDEFVELLDELETILKQKDKYIGDEMDEIERAVQDLSRDGSLEITVQDVVRAFTKAKEIVIPKDVWLKLENTESNQIKKGEMKKVIAIAKQYNKTSPLELKKALVKDEYNPPLILKFGDRYHLVAGNTRLCTAAALGIKPRVIIAEVYPNT
jgi:ElaB/YqjD/DUF883 family membrane-anchored ribosome-binding protein